MEIVEEKAAKTSWGIEDTKGLFSLTHAASKDETRPRLGNVWLLASGKAVGCDGHIMVYGDHGLDGLAEDVPVSRDICKIVMRWKNGATLRLDTQNNYTLVESGGPGTLSIDRSYIDSTGKPNDFAQIMPDESKYKRPDGPIGMNLKLLTRIDKALARTPSQDSNCQCLFKDKLSPVVIKPMWETAMQAVIMPVRI